MSSSNVSVLEQALDYLAQVIQWQIQACFKGESQGQVRSEYPKLPNHLLATDVPLAQFIRSHKLDSSEQLVLLIALAPHLQQDL